MTNILLIAILACGVGILGLLAVVSTMLYSNVRVFTARYDEARVAVQQVYESVLAFLTPPSDGQPSALSQMADRFAVACARAVAAQFKTQIMGELSGEARRALSEKGSADLEEANQVPLMPALMQAVPGLTGNIKRGKGAGWLDIARAILPALANRGSGAGMPKSNGHSGMTIT